jgi:hypothetical protein
VDKETILLTILHVLAQQNAVRENTGDTVERLEPGRFWRVSRIAAIPRQVY